MSKIVPANTLATGSCRSFTAATAPAPEALPVTWSTSHGSTTIAIPLPTPHARLPASSRIRGVRRTAHHPPRADDDAQGRAGSSPGVGRLDLPDGGLGPRAQ